MKKILFCFIFCFFLVFPVAAEECSHEQTYILSCSTKGIEEVRCSSCHELLEVHENVSFDKSIHSPNGIVEVLEATCSKDGSEMMECTICHYPIIISVTPATNEHTLVFEDDSSCMMICTGCYDTFYNEDPNDFHHKGEPATCTEGSYCKVCNLKLSDPLGHTIINNNCTEFRYCSRCYASMELSSHNMIDGICSECGYTINVLSNEKVIKEAAFEWIKNRFIELITKLIQYCKLHFLL